MRRLALLVREASIALSLRPEFLGGIRRFQQDVSMQCNVKLLRGLAFVMFTHLINHFSLLSKRLLERLHVYFLPSIVIAQVVGSL